MTRIINNTKIQYLSVADRIYKVIDIDFCNLIIEVIRTDLSIVDVPESEVFPFEEFREFRIRLCNGAGDCGGRSVRGCSSWCLGKSVILALLFTKPIWRLIASSKNKRISKVQQEPSEITFFVLVI